jgi:HEAT repeat protein
MSIFTRNKSGNRLRGAETKSLRGTVFALGQMEKALTSKNDPALRGRAAKVIRRLKKEKATDILLACLRDSDTMTRRGAAWALGMMGDGRAVDGLKIAMKDRDWEVRACAAEALGNHGRYPHGHAWKRTDMRRLGGMLRN